MRFSLRWLREYLQTEASTRELLDAITDVGLEIEEVLDLGAVTGKVVVGQIQSIEKVEKSDHLSLCVVTAGGEAPLRIICGAGNIEVGQRVPLALIGATLPNGLTLKKKPVMGIESQGMMCSARELKVGEDHSGIWILPPETPLGEAFDALLTIKVTPNRPDALALVGVARDVAARTGGRLRYPALKLVEGDDRTDSVAKVTIEAREACPRYTARVIRNVRVGESPLWLRHKLEGAGLRSINNIVDVTNFVMLELGHPLHAFDMDRINGRHVIVRHAQEGEKMALLDGTEVDLQTTDLLIADPKGAIALAGIMGGGNSEINEGTTNVLLESAYFNPVTVRRTAKRLDLSTDASYRFERGTDAQRLTFALNRAAQLIAELGGGEVLRGHIDAVGVSLPEAPTIALQVERLNRVLGMKLTAREIGDVLTPLGFEIRRSDGAEMAVVPPSHRVDVSREADIVEEVARILGYDKVPSSLPALTIGHVPADPGIALQRTAADVMVGLGLSQAVNFSFVSEGANAAMDLADGRQVRLLNPMVQEQAVMRRSLLPSLLQNVAHNINHGVEDIRLFEVGTTYAWAEDLPGSEGAPRQLQPPAIERASLAAVLCGGARRDWRSPARPWDFYDIKALAEGLLEGISAGRTQVEAVSDVAFLHPGRAATFVKGGERLCWFGELHPMLARELGFKKPVFLLEASLPALLTARGEGTRFTELPKYPAMRRDIALVVDSKARSLEMERTIRSSAKEILSDISLFDVYEGDRLGAGKKSLAYSLCFRHRERTLQDEEVSQAMDKILAALEKKHGATLRTA